MKIKATVSTIQDKVRKSGNYKRIADDSGLNYHWVQKFAIGKITNPCVNNVAALQDYFDSCNASSVDN